MNYLDDRLLSSSGNYFMPDQSDSFLSYDSVTLFVEHVHRTLWNLGLPCNILIHDRLKNDLCDHFSSNFSLD